MNKKIHVIVKLPEQEEKEEDIPNDFHILMHLCEGLFDITYLPVDESVNVIVNDSFLHNGMKPNIVTPENEGVFCGPLVFTGYDPKTGETTSLNEKQIKTVKAYIKRNEVHNMSLNGAFLYAKAIRPLQECQDALWKMEEEEKRVRP